MGVLDFDFVAKKRLDERKKESAKSCSCKVMGSSKKGNFIKEFIISFLWSTVQTTEKSRKREKSPVNSDSEPEAVEKKTPKVEKKGQKRPIESENSGEIDDEIKRSKSSTSTRNEITSSLSSSVQKKRSANFDSDDSDSDVVDTAPKKVLKSNTTIEEETENKAEVELIPTRKLIFSKQLSPKKILKHISIEEEEESSELDNNIDLDTNKLLVKKDVFTDAKALLADQEKSEERGKKLLEAFDD